MTAKPTGNKAVAKGKAPKAQAARKAAPGRATRKLASKKAAAPAKPQPQAKATPKKPAPQPARKPERSAKPRVAVASAKRKPPERVQVAARPRPLQGRKLEEFRDQLLEKHRDLLQSYTSTKGDSRSRQSDGTEDYIDYAVSSYDREFLLSLTELEQRELLLVEDALRRLERGDFGRCMQCGQQIPPKRLEVQPWARYCVACQELEDQGLLEPPELEGEEDEDAKPVEEEDFEVEKEQEIEYREDLEPDESGDDEEEENMRL